MAEATSDIVPQEEEILKSSRSWLASGLMFAFVFGLLGLLGWGLVPPRS